MRGDERMIADTPIARPRNTSSKPVMARAPERENRELQGQYRGAAADGLVLAPPSGLMHRLHIPASIAPTGSGDAGLGPARHLEGNETRWYQVPGVIFAPSGKQS